MIWTCLLISMYQIEWVCCCVRQCRLDCGCCFTRLVLTLSCAQPGKIAVAQTLMLVYMCGSCVFGGLVISLLQQRLSNDVVKRCVLVFLLFCNVQKRGRGSSVVDGNFFWCRLYVKMRTVGN